MQAVEGLHDFLIYMRMGAKRAKRVRHEYAADVLHTTGGFFINNEKSV